MASPKPQVSKLFARFCNNPTPHRLLAILLIGGIGGVIFWGGFNTFMEYTNTMTFCISCHEMEQNVYQEYKQTVHYRNRTGVRVVCSDCHVPRDWTAKLNRKIHATKELYYWMTGSIDTPEKFESKRMEMAKRVWSSMEQSDSRECRNCHDYSAMRFDWQSENSQESHPGAMEEGDTCIDCHKGIAHQMPYDPDE